MDANYLQKRMEEIQNSGDLSDIMGKILSGKSGYKAVIEKKQIRVQCASCGTIFENPIKFCSECGTKIEIPKKE